MRVLIAFALMMLLISCKEKAAFPENKILTVSEYPNPVLVKIDGHFYLFYSRSNILPLQENAASKPLVGWNDTVQAVIRYWHIIPISKHIRIFDCPDSQFTQQ